MTTLPDRLVLLKKFLAEIRLSCCHPQGRLSSIVAAKCSNGMHGSDINLGKWVWTTFKVLAGIFVFAFVYRVATLSKTKSPSADLWLSDSKGLEGITLSPKDQNMMKAFFNDQNMKIAERDVRPPQQPAVGAVGNPVPAEVGKSVGVVGKPVPTAAVGNPVPAVVGKPVGVVGKPVPTAAVGNPVPAVVGKPVGVVGKPVPTAVVGNRVGLPAAKVVHSVVAAQDSEADVDSEETESKSVKQKPIEKKVLGRGGVKPAKRTGLAKMGGAGAPRGKPKAVRRPPQAVKQPPQAVKRPPQAVKRPPQAGKRPPQAGKRPPQAGKRPPQAVKRPPQAVKRPPQAVKRSPQAVKRPPQAVKRPPQAVKRPRQAVKRPPPVVKRPPKAVKRPLKAGSAGKPKQKLLGAEDREPVLGLDFK